LTVFLSNAGGIWDNAKKSIEGGPRNPKENTGKGSERHKVGAIVDTVGDPIIEAANLVFL
jgi:K(+)-stimulated pyrophosphate-energized sodium pump